ncbi:MAG: DUF1501 domain-containing protein [Candidatus Methylacidiphilales bacterium]|nr:DUF1501 domain-containing protein [Candidatus Methylacidiphilales bacterium]
MSDNIQTLVTGNGDQPRTLVVIFLRGAADGLSLVPPLGDDAYHRARPLIRLSRETALPLDGFFGLHPLLKELLPAYKDGQMAIVHAAGSEDTTRSHFEAQDYMEHGGLAAGGWLGRFLRYGSSTAHSALAAITLGPTLPESMRGAPAATAMESLDQYALSPDTDKLTRQLRRLYEMQRGEIATAGRETLDALARIQTLRTTTYSPAHGAQYDTDAFSQRLRLLAQLIKAKVGLEAASVDLGGWDSHFTQSAVMDPLILQLGRGLGAFYRDLGPAMATTSVVVMTEFGRRVAENSSFGTDHGRGSVMLALGGGIRGGRVAGTWPGLTADILEGPGDLPVTHNYRNVLAPILRRHGAADKLGVIFPDFQLNALDI